MPTVVGHDVVAADAPAATSTAVVEAQVARGHSLIYSSHTCKREDCRCDRQRFRYASNNCAIARARAVLQNSSGSRELKLGRATQK